MKLFHALLKTNNNLAPLIARVVLGIVIFPHGAHKALGWFGGYGYSGTMNWFATQLHIAAPLTFLAIVAEFAGGLALIAGRLGRLAACGVAVNMLVAVAVVHAPYGFFMNWFGNQKGEGIEFHLLALGLAAIVILQGAGKCSLDRLHTRPASAP